MNISNNYMENVIVWQVRGAVIVVSECVAYHGNEVMGWQRMEQICTTSYDIITVIFSKMAFVCVIVQLAYSE